MLSNRLFESNFAIVVCELETNRFGFVNRRNFLDFANLTKHTKSNGNFISELIFYHDYQKSILIQLSVSTKKKLIMKNHSLHGNLINCK